jgi:hypothetical protein
MSHDGPFIPEASEPDTFVRGRLATAEHAKDVRRGWKAGCWYIALQLLGIASLSFVGDVGLRGAGFVLVEIAFVAACVWGVSRWHLLPAAALFCLPILNTLLLAAQPIGPVPQPGTGGVRVLFLVIFLYFFARASLAIWRFHRSAPSAA